MVRFIISVVAIFFLAYDSFANGLYTDTTDIGYIVKRKTISKKTFERMKKVAATYNYENSYMHLDSTSIMNLLNDSTLLSNCFFAKDILEETINNNINHSNPWDEHGDYRMGITKYDNKVHFLEFYYPIDVVSYLITDTTRNSVYPYTLESALTAYNRNGLIAGTEGEDEISNTVIHIYKIDNKKVSQLTYYNNSDSSPCDIFWIGDDSLYVESLIYKKDFSLKPIYYKLTFTKK